MGTYMKLVVLTGGSDGGSNGGLMNLDARKVQDDLVDRFL